MFSPRSISFSLFISKVMGGKKKPTGWLKICERLGKGPMMTQFQSKSLVGTGSPVPVQGREIIFTWPEFDRTNLQLLRSIGGSYGQDTLRQKKEASTWM